MLTNDLLKTPQEFINEETDNLKNFFKDNNDLQINKLGVIGYFINLLGNIRYDSTQYYQKLFQESNIITARDEKNLYLHGAIYKYNFNFAQPSVAEGNFIFDFNTLPIDGKLTKRTVTFQDISFSINEIKFTSDTIYKFVEEGNSYYAILYLEDGTITHIPSSSSRIIAPFVNVFQKTKLTDTFKLTNYPLFSYYTYSFDTEDQFLNTLEVYVKERNKTYENTLGDQFEIKSIKLEETSTTKSCFLTMTESRKYLLEFGSGIRGRHIPDADITLIKNLTNGENGHIGIKHSVYPSNTCETILKKYTDNLNYTSVNLSNRLVNIDFEFSNNGSNPKTDNLLRKDIIEHIQTRNFLISKRDFNNLTDIEDNEFIYSFKKSSIQRNDFFLHQCFRDEFQIPIKTLCYNFRTIKLDETVQNFTFNRVTHTEGILTGVLQYYIFATDGFYISDITYIILNCNFDNAIELTWDEFENAQYYMIVVFDGEDYRYLKTDTNYLLDIGQLNNTINTFSFIEEENETDSSIIFSWDENYVFFPEFLIDEINFISPCIYKYNSFMNWFEGHLFNDDFIILFSQKQFIYNIVENYTIPYFHAQIKYNYFEKKTEIYIISQQESINYIPTISISNTTIKDQKLTRIDINKFYIEFKENKYGILPSTHTLDLLVYYSNESDEIISNAIVNYSTENFSQIQNVFDQIKILTYLDHSNTNHIISIPLMEKSVYIENKELYNIKLLHNLSNVNLSENRFPNDDIQYRFINSYKIEQLYLRNILKQLYNFDLILPLKLKIDIYFDQLYLDSNHVNLTKEKDNLYLELSQLLEKKYTGNNIKFYNTHIIDYIHNKPFVKTLSMQVTDSNENILTSGLETYTENEILENLQNDIYSTDEIIEPKLHICYYTPYYFWWDINDINITYHFS